MKTYLTELIGTFFLVLVIALSGNPIAIGVILMVMVYMGGHISGAHYNPAVSFAAWMRKKISLATMGQYRVAQMVGAILATAVAVWMTGEGLVPIPGDGVATGQAVVAEIIFTFALVSVILNVAMTKATAGNQYYGLAIGLTVLAAAYAIGPISGGALNPAVGVGPLLVEAVRSSDPAIGHFWIYLVGPFVGALIAALLHPVMNDGED